MAKSSEYSLHARSLRADIMAAPAVWLPRREILLQWLEAFLTRAEKPGYDLGDTEAADLTALDQFLRKRSVPASQG